VKHVDPASMRLPFALAVVLAVSIGIGVATQSRINGQLGQEIGNGQVAALVSFGSGLLIVAIVMAFAPSGRRGEARLLAAVRERRFPWVFALGGAIGAFFVLTQGLVAGVAGVALFTIAVVAGQTLSGTLIDRRGLGTMPARAITWRRVLGAVLALGAVVLGASTQLRSDVPVWLLILPFVAGLGVAWQQAVNGQVREVSHSVLTATFNNFVVGTSVLVVIVLVGSIWTAWPSQWPTNPVLYIGGAIGLLFIAVGALVVRTTGALLLGLCTIAGQLIASVLLDLIIPVPGHTLTLTAVLAAGIALCGVIIASSPSSRDHAGTQDQDASTER
jgi:transporter family-2 protein